MPRKINNFFVIPCALLLLVIACDSKQVYDAYQSVPEKWHKDSLITFKLTAPDTTNAYNLHINLRNTNDYQYSNLFLIAELQYPNGKTIKDTLEYKIAAPNGELLGKGFTDVKESKLWYKGYDEPFIFKESGDYIVTLQQAMRRNGDVNGVLELEGVTDIGFRVEHKE